MRDQTSVSASFVSSWAQQTSSGGGTARSGDGGGGRRNEKLSESPAAATEQRKKKGNRTTLLVAGYFMLFCLVQVVVFLTLHPSSSKVSTRLGHSLDEAASFPLNLWEELHLLENSSPNSKSLSSLPLGSPSSLSTWNWHATDTPLQVLQKLTTPSKPYTCPPDTIAIHNTFADASMDLTVRKIPKVIHQTSKSPCITKVMQQRGAVVGWQEEFVTRNGYSYAFHDDEAVERLLLARDWPEFPLLHDIVAHCTIHPTVKADLWRYVVLWEFGGIYTDIDTAPAFGDSRFHAGTLKDDTDGWMLVTFYGVLSQWHMVVSPRHPFMYYAVQFCLESLMMQRNAEFFKPVEVTGPNLLIKAFVAWIRDGKEGKDLSRVNWSDYPMEAGVYTDGTGRSLTVGGTRTTVNDLVRRDVLGRSKTEEYAKLKMTYNAEFHQEDSQWRKTNKSCVHKLRRATEVRMGIGEEEEEEQAQQGEAAEGDN